MSRFRVMVVDDDADVRFVVTSLLALEFETVGAQNGLDALEKIDRYEPDLLLMEVRMPLMNGIACCQAIQKNPYFEKLPVMFLAAASDPETKKLAMSVGGQAYIEKPFETAHLVTRIKDFFASSKMTPSLKEFTLEEIAEIDALPLDASSSGILPAIKLVSPSAEPTAQIHNFSGIDPARQKDKKRRIFGAAAHRDESSSGFRPIVPTPKPAEANHPPEQTHELPRQEEPRRSLPKVPKLPAKSPPSAPPPPLAPPASRTSLEKIPQGAVTRELSPAEVLAQRRLGKSAGKGSSATGQRPRVLAIIDYPELLEQCAAACRGIADFLPLEDPIEAVELIARYQPEVVLLGIQSGAYSGLQVVQMVASNQRLAHIEFVFLQGPQATQPALAAARKMTRNPILRSPVEGGTLGVVMKEILARPDFRVRMKNLPYGAYVKDVLKKAEHERAVDNKVREKKSLAQHHRSLANFMEAELKDYEEPAGVEELYGIGRKMHVVKE